MNILERNENIKNYIFQINDYFISIGYPISNDTFNKIYNTYIQSDKSFEEIKKEIDILVKQKLVQIKQQIELMKKITSIKVEIDDNERRFGQSINFLVVGLFQKIEELEDMMLSEQEKAVLFEKWKLEFLQQFGELSNNYINLSYETTKNLYNNFVNDIDIITDEWRCKMEKMINNQVPLFDENGKLNRNAINTGPAEFTLDFSLRHGKELKFHNILWHYGDSFPATLEAILANKSSSERREITISFLEQYISFLADWAKNKGYNFTKIDVLNEIANNKDNTAQIFRDSKWTWAFGIEPLGEKKDNISDQEYQIMVDEHTKKCAEAYSLVMKIAKRHFPNSKLIYNEYNEFVPYKADRIHKIIEEFQKIESRDAIKFIDGLGMQSHYTDYLQLSSGRTIEITPEDIFYSMEKYSSLGIDLYRSEKDMIYSSREKKDSLEKFIELADEKYGIKDIISWNSNDTTSWRYDESKQDVHMVDKYGYGKQEYEFYASRYSQTRKNSMSKVNTEQLQNQKVKKLAKKQLPTSTGFSNILILLLIISIFITAFYIGNLLMN